MIINNLDDTTLINNVREGIQLNESTKELIHRHSGVYFKVASQFKSNPNVNFNDVIDNKDFNIYHAALNYDSSRGTFCNLVGQMARYECLKHIQSKKTEKIKTIEIDSQEEYFAPPVSEDNVVSNVGLNETYETIDEVLSHFDKETRAIFSQRINGDKGRVSWRDLKDRSNYSHESLRTKNKKIINKLKEKLQVA